jgi:PIN domain nuclease of toxin-antitoxin system
MINAPALLLDTCAVIFTAEFVDIKPDADAAINNSSNAGQTYVSPVTAWELGMAMARGRFSSPLPTLEFFNRYLERGQCNLCELTPEILVQASYLPGHFHRDPADRLLVTTARVLDLILVTRDRAILAYGAEGHVKTLAC